MVGAIPRPARDLLPEASIHEHRHHQQHDRNRDLSGHEQRPAPTAPAAGRDAVAGFHDRRQIGTRRLDRRYEAEEHGARDRDDEAEQQRAPIHLERDQDGQIRRQFDLPEQRHAGVADAETQHAARQGDQQAFRDQLPDEPAASGADGEAQRHLARSHGGPAGQQSGDVGAGYKQEQGDRGHCGADNCPRLRVKPRKIIAARNDADIGPHDRRARTEL